MKTRDRPRYTNLTYMTNATIEVDAYYDRGMPLFGYLVSKWRGLLTQKNRWK